HLLGLRVIEELLGDAAVALVERDPNHHEADRSDDPWPARPTEDSGGRALRIGAAARAGADQDLHCEDTECPVGEAARKRGEPLEPGIAAFGPAPEDGAADYAARIVSVGARARERRGTVATVSIRLARSRVA